MSGINASPRTACVWPENVLTALWVCHSLIVLSALPAAPMDMVEGGVVTVQLTSQILVLIYNEYRPHRLRVAGKVVYELEVLPDLSSPANLI